MDAPYKIYLSKLLMAGAENLDKPVSDSDVCYVRQDIYDETIEVAEDHAYFAGKEKLREKLLEWAKGQHERLMDGFRREVFGLAERNMADAYKKVIDKLNSL